MNQKTNEAANPLVPRISRDAFAPRSQASRGWNKAVSRRVNGWGLVDAEQHRVVLVKECDLVHFETPGSDLDNPVPMSAAMKAHARACAIDWAQRNAELPSPGAASAVAEEKQEMTGPGFTPGDVVCWTNDYGVKWHARRVVRVEAPDQWGHRYYLEPTDAPWMYVREKNLAHESLSRDEIERTLPHDGSLRRHCESSPEYLDEVVADISARRTDLFSVGQRFTFQSGQSVTCNGYPGTVKRMYGEGMVEVHVPGGLTRVSASYPDCYPN